MSRILIVEDDRVARNCLRDLLALVGHECVCASDGAEALAVLEDCITIDLIITDLHMPEMDGIQLIGALRDHPAFKQIPTILMSGQLSADLAQRATQAGAGHLLGKPYDFRALVRTIAAILSPSDP